MITPEKTKNLENPLDYGEASIYVLVCGPGLRTIHPHPTVSESLMMAAEAYEGTITDLYLPKK